MKDLKEIIQVKVPECVGENIRRNIVQSRKVSLGVVWACVGLEDNQDVLRGHLSRTGRKRGLCCTWRFTGILGGTPFNNGNK